MTGIEDAFGPAMSGAELITPDAKTDCLTSVISHAVRRPGFEFRMNFETPSKWSNALLSVRQVRASV